MRLGLSHKELDSLIHALDEIVDVYQDDVEMQREVGNDFQVWRRLLGRAKSLRDARIEGTLCQGCGDPRTERRTYVVQNDPPFPGVLPGAGDHSAEAPDKLVRDESRDGPQWRRHGPDEGREHRRLDPDRGPEGGRREDEPMGHFSAESRQDGTDEAKSWIQRFVEALKS